MSTQEERDRDPIVGRRVKTIRSATPDSTWSEEVRQSRKWGVFGYVKDLSNAHGLCYKVEHEDGTCGWYDPEEFNLADDEVTPLVRTRMVNDNFAGKTIQRVDAQAINAWTFHFTDGTQVILETEAVFPSMGLYGIGMSEPGFDPKETMGPGRKPGDVRKALQC